MAIYHLSAQVIGRKSGGNAVAAAAYRAGEKLGDYDYTRKESVDYTAIFTPENAPEWSKNRKILWEKVEQTEKRIDAQLCREINLALPLELKKDEQINLLKKFVRNFTELGMVADTAIHQQAGNNPHAHIMLTTRELTADGFGSKRRDWNRRELLHDWREQWAEITNQELARAGHDARIDHRSLAAQGIDRIPTVHEGKNVKYYNEKLVSDNKYDTRVRQLNFEISIYNECKENIKVWEKELNEIREKLEKSKKAELLSNIAEVQRDRFDVAACIALNIYNGDAKTLLKNTKYPTRQINYFLERMNSIGVIDENFNVIKENIRIDDFFKEKINKFCVLKRKINEHISFEELSISGVSDTLERYSYIQITSPQIEHNKEQRENKADKKIENNDKKPLNQLEGVELLPIIERLRKEQTAASNALQNAKKYHEYKDIELSHCKRDMQEHNNNFNSMGFFKKIVNSGEINRRAKELEERFELCLQNYNSAKDAVTSAENDMKKANTALMDTLSKYKKTPHAKAVEKEKQEAREQQRQQRRQRELEREQQRQRSGMHR